MPKPWERFSARVKPWRRYAKSAAVRPGMDPNAEFTNLPTFPIETAEVTTTGTAPANIHERATGPIELGTRRRPGTTIQQEALNQLRARLQEGRSQRVQAAQAPSIARAGTGVEGALPQFRGEEFLSHPTISPVGAMLRGSFESVRQGIEEGRQLPSTQAFPFII